MSEICAREVIATLGMERHPEGGWYVQTFEDTTTSKGRARSTAIYYLLERSDRSHWHRVDAVEVWHYYAGAPLNLHVSDGEHMDIYRLGPEITKGDRPQVVVPQRAWQAAESIGDWTLVGCTVAPGFLFSGFELAPSDWVPGKG
jgi:hypothetical protein